jgi:hypothetical protein
MSTTRASSGWLKSLFRVVFPWAQVTYQVPVCLLTYVSSTGMFVNLRIKYRYVCCAARRLRPFAWLHSFVVAQPLLSTMYVTEGN